MRDQSDFKVQVNLASGTMQAFQDNQKEGVMPNLGMGTVKKHHQNVFLIEGAMGTLAANGDITIRPVANGHPWVVDVPLPGSINDVSAMIEGTLNLIKGAYRCTVAPTPANGMTASFTPHTE